MRQVTSVSAPRRMLQRKQPYPICGPGPGTLRPFRHAAPQGEVMTTCQAIRELVGLKVRKTICVFEGPGEIRH